MSIPEISSPDRIQERLLKLTALFLFLFALALTLAPAARGRDWQADYPLNHWLGWVAWMGIFALAHHWTCQHLPQRDPYLLPLSALLSGWGLLTIWRLMPGFGQRQTLWLIFSIALVILGVRFQGLFPIPSRY
mgnify:CR=1 FL=1